MARSKWKSILQQNTLIQARQNLITPNLINKLILIHNGKMNKTLKIKTEHLGFKFGELIYTKITPKYKQNVN